MSNVSTSFVAPARVRTLLVPVGRIKKSRFESFTSRLYPEAVVRLSDISPDGRPDRNMFSPMAFPTGVMLYNMTTALPPEAHASLSPYEVFRETLVVIGIADAQANGVDETDIERLEETMNVISNDLKEALTAHVFLFDVDGKVKLPSTISAVPPKNRSDRTTIKTVMCDVSARFLSDLVLLARKVQNAKAIDVPETLSARPNRDSTHSQPADILSQPSRPGTPLSVVNGSQDPASPHSSNVAALRRVTEEDGRTSSSSRPQSPANGMRPPSAISNDGRSGSPEDWETATGSKTRPTSSGGLPIQVKTASATDRAKNKLKARQSIIIGSLYIQAGRWPDALRELTDGTTRARAFGDHSYHAKGLEYILVTMILMAWIGHDFSIPSVCNATTKESRNRRSFSLTGFSTGTSSSSDAQTKALTQVSATIPELANSIVNILSRPVNIFGQSMPQLSFSESIIRLSQLYAVLYHCSGLLTLDALRSLVLGTTLPTPKGRSLPQIISKREISSLLFRGYPTLPPDSTQAMFDASIILSGMSTVLSDIGLHRKRAVLIRDMLAMMIPGLIQARKVGAAEVGIHPAASLAALHGLSQDGSGYSPTAADGELEKGLRALMLQLCHSFGLSIDDWGTPRYDVSSVEADNSAIAATLNRGEMMMKLEILRLCMNFAEALPNFKDVMWFAANMLKVAGPKRLPPIDAGVDRVGISSAEQKRVGTKIYRMLGVVKASDVDQLSTDYWDRYMVRGIELSEPPVSKVLVSRTPSDFAIDAAKRNRASSAVRQGPFIHDASLAVPQTKNSKQVAAAQQRSEFWVQLQNPFDFEIVVENISLITEGAAFSQRPQTVVVGPACVQRTLISGIIDESGTLTIKGCRIRVQGCKEEDYAVHEDSWHPKRDLKIKLCGSKAVLSPKSRPLPGESTESNEPTELAPTNLPTPKSVEIIVAPAQPVCALGSHSLSQSIMTILEGEMQSFAVTIRNISETIPVNFVHVSFEHALRPSGGPELRGVAGQIQAYEMKEASLSRPPFRWVRDLSPTTIAPGQSASFTIEVFGLHGMTEGTVHIDYANTPCPVAEMSASTTFYTRRVSLPFGVTVTSNLELQRFQILTLEAALPHIDPAASDAAKLINRINAVSARREFFILLADIRNNWAKPLDAVIDVLDPVPVASSSPPSSPSRSSKLPRPPTSSAPLVSLTEQIPPGGIKRVALPIPLLQVSNPRRPPSWTEHAQYVVPDPESAADQAKILELFWCKHALLRGVRGEWREVDGGPRARAGTLDLAGISIGEETLPLVRRGRIGVAVDVIGGDGQLLKRDEGGKVALEVGVGVKVRARLTNREGGEAMNLKVRVTARALLPGGGGGGGGGGGAAPASSSGAADLSRRLCWTSAMERRVYGLRGATAAATAAAANGEEKEEAGGNRGESGSEREIVWGAVGVSSGLYAVDVSVERMTTATTAVTAARKGDDGGRSAGAGGAAAGAEVVRKSVTLQVVRGGNNSGGNGGGGGGGGGGRQQQP